MLLLPWCAQKIFVCVLLAWIHILSGYTTLYRGEFSSPSSPDRELLPPGLKVPPKSPVKHS